jgi:hypothetical protein
MLQLFISLVLLASVFFDTALASQEKLAIKAQMLYRAATEASHKCPGLNKRFYSRYGEEELEGWERYHSLRTADKYIDEVFISCISDELCKNKTPRDISAAKNWYVQARVGCARMNLNKGTDPALESNELQSLDEESFPVTNVSTTILSFTTENLIYLVTGVLLGALGRTYLPSSPQGGEFAKSSKLRRPEL